MVNKKIQINWSPPPHYKRVPGIKFVGIGYSEESGKKKLYQITQFYTCREEFVDELIEYLIKKSTNEYTMPRTQFIVTRDQKYSNLAKNRKLDNLWMETAERILNLFEKRMSWKLTTISKIPAPTRFLNTYLVSGSSKWSHCPQLFSLYLLIIRLSDNKHFRSITKLEDIDKIVKKSRTEDMLFLKKLQPVLLNIVDNVRRLFFFRSINNSYYTQKGCDGINDYLSGYCDDVLIDKYRKYIGKLDVGCGYR